MKDNSVFPDKYLKKLTDEFVSNANGMSEAELKKVIFESEGSIYGIEKAKEADNDLNDAKAKVKELSKTYREDKAEQTAKIQYALWVMESRGINIG